MDRSLSPIPTFVHALRLLLQHWIVLLTLPFVVGLGLVAVYSLVLNASYFAATFVVSFLVASYALLVSYLLAQRADVGYQESLDAFLKRAANMLAFALIISVLSAVLQTRASDAAPVPVVSIAIWYLLIRLMVLPSVIAVEDYSLIESVKRAWSLTGSDHRGTVIIGLLTGVACFVILTTITLVPLVILAPASRGEEPWGLLLVFVVSTIVGSILCLPFVIAVQAAVYLRLASGRAPSDAAMESSAQGD